MRGAPSLEHVVALSDDVGIHQHAIRDVPNRKEGYCTDDVARAFMVALAASTHEPQRSEAMRLARIYLAFLSDAQRTDGRSHNFMSYARTWLDEAGTQDSNGRALWAFGYGMRFAPRDSWREICGTLLRRAAVHVEGFEFTRPRAYAALGLAHAFAATGRSDRALAALLRSLGDDFARRHADVSGPDWKWFENEMTYDNARLCEALLRIGTVLEDSALVTIGLETLEFYESVVIENGTFVPIGNAGWYVRGGRRARYAQQPLEAAALVDAALAAEALTGKTRYRRLAESGLDWYLGRNSRDAVLVRCGGCFDGLEELGVNQNMGAESTLAYLASALALAESGADILRVAR